MKNSWITSPEPSMAESDTINQETPVPVTLSSLSHDLEALGLSKGVNLLVHSSLSSLGWVAGGAQTVVMALNKVVGQKGTLVMPTHTGHLSEPSEWENPPVPEKWWPIIRKNLPAYDPFLSPSWGMGSIPELFRTTPGARRSFHPNASFAARGPLARFILRDKKLDFMMDDTSPLGRLYDLDAQVLLLGVGYDKNTCFHLAEYRSSWPGKITVPCAAPVAKPFRKKRTWVQFKDINFFSEDFPAIGEFLEEKGVVKVGTVGAAQVKLFPIRAAVDIAVQWMNTNRVAL